MILLTGATGTVGSEVAKALGRMGVPYRCLVRDRVKAAAIAGADADMVEADLSRPETLPAALEGVEKAFLVTAPSPEMLPQERSFIRVARRSGVGYVVKLSVYGAHPRAPHFFGRQHGESERVLEDSGVPFTMLRPNGFFQNFLGNAASLRERGAIHAPAGEMHFSAVDVRDIAAVAARVLTEPGHQWQRYTITGPEALSYAEIAGRFSRVLGRAIRYVDVAEDAARQWMLEAGIPAWTVDKVLDLYRYYRTGAASEVTNYVEQVGRKAPIRFEAFVRDHAIAFGGQSQE